MQGNIGKMDRRVIIESRSVAIDAYGDQGETCATLYEVWAGYSPKRLQGDSLAEMARQDQFFEAADFTIRYVNVPTDSRILYNGHIWKIISMREIGRRDRLAITAYKTDSNLYS